MDVQAEVFLLAENRLLREALIRILAKKTNIRVVGAAPYSPATMEQIIALNPKIVVLDSVGPVFSDTRLVSLLHAAIPGVRVAMIDMDLDQHTFLKAVGEGVVGYVLKDASAAEVAGMIRAVAAGEAVCPPTLSMALFLMVRRRLFVGTASQVLSRREQELATLLRERLTNKEIAARLNLSEQTVKNHVHRMLRKIGAKDRMAIVKRYELDGLGEHASLG
jgi:two-component system, NarL family, response regulator DevR